MVYFVIILIVICLIFLAIIVKKNERIENMSGRNLSETVQEISSKIPQYCGFGVSTFFRKKLCAAAFRVVNKKVKKGIELLDFEKWYYDNYFILQKYNKSSYYACLAELPHVNNKARILKLSASAIYDEDFIISNSAIEKILKSIQEKMILNYHEILSFQNACIFNLMDRYAISAQKIIKLNRYQKYADKKIIRKLSNDIFYLYYIKNKGGDISSTDRNIGNIDLNFAQIILSESRQIGNAISSIRFLEDLDPISLVKSSRQYEILSCNEIFMQSDEMSQKMCMNQIFRVARSSNRNELRVIDEAFDFMQLTNTNIFEALFDQKKSLLVKIRKGKIRSYKHRTFLWYFSTLLFLNFSISIALSFLSQQILVSVAIGILSFLAMCKISQLLTNAFVSRFTISKPIPMLKSSQSSAAIVISELISDKESVNKAVEHASVIKNADRFPVFILCDLKSSDREVNENDSEIIEYLKNTCGRADISFAVRKRVKTGKVFGGWERKRGAIMDFCDYLINGNEKFIAVSQADLPEFLILLDSDNLLLPGDAYKAVCAMSHVYHKKLDLMSFNAIYNLRSFQSLYAFKYYNESGVETYGSYSDFYYNLFSKAIFCGKGIIRLHTFYKKLYNAFPDNTVLSHDIIEGASVQTGLLSQKVFEDAPSTFLSEEKRKVRWLRGDIQLLPFLSKKVKNREGKKRENPIGCFYRHLIVSNAFANGLFHIAASILFILGCIINVTFLYAFSVIFLLQYLPDVISVLCKLGKNYKIQTLIFDTFRMIVTILSDFLLSVYRSINWIITFAVCMYRMLITRKNLLAWQAFGLYQGKSKFMAHFSLLIPTFLVLAAMSISFFNITIAVYTVLFVSYGIGLFFISRPLGKKLMVKEKEYLTSVAEKTFHYFKSMRENGLICDNYQSKPSAGKRNMTSPTNIGFSMLSEICGYYLGFIEKAEAEERIEKTLEVVKLLDKWKGNLYNWYKDNKVVGNFVSSVDSANFLAALICVKEFVASETLKEKTRKLLESTDLMALYDHEKKLFFIGVENGNFCGHYDLLASEARILSYLASAYYGLSENWCNLARDCTSLKGNTLLSWSGTAFEYFMPELFFDTPKYSLIGKTLRNVAKIQKENACETFFGIGESAYYKFDQNANYQYHAFGVSSLSLRSEFNRCVISPYSSILSIEYLSNAVIENMKKLENIGMSDSMGFYESVDFTKGFHIIYSHMSHHQGMILCALTNYLKNNAVRHLFNQDKKCQAASLLLCEKPLSQKFIRRKKQNYVSQQNNEFSVISSPVEFPVCGLLTNGFFTHIGDECGGNQTIYNDVTLCKFRDSIYRKNGAFVVLEENGNKYSPTFFPLADSRKNYKTEFFQDRIEYTNINKNVKMIVTIPPHFNGEIRKVVIKNNDKNTKVMGVSFYGDLCLNYLDADLAHPVYSDMFIETFVENGALFANRRSKNKYASICTVGLENVEYESNRLNAVGRLGEKSENQTETSVGTVLYPCFSFRATITVEGESEKEFYILVAMAENKESILAMTDKIKSAEFLEYVKDASIHNSLSLSRKLIKNVKQFRDAQILLSKLIYEPNHFTVQYNTDFEGKTILLDLKSKFKLKYYADILNFLKNANLNIQIFVMIDKEDGYYKEESKSIKELFDPRFRLTVVERKIFNAYADINIKNNLFLHIKDDSIIEMPLIYNKNNHKIDYKEVKAEDVKKENRMIISELSHGGFTEKGEYVIDDKTELPFSNVICEENGGFIATENGGGYTYFENSRENKVSLWYNDPILDTPSENVYLTIGHLRYRINRGDSANSYTVHGIGYTTYVQNDKLFKSDVKLYTANEGKQKIYRIHFKNLQKKEEVFKLSFNMDVVLNWKQDRNISAQKINSQTVKFKNAFTGKEFYFYISQGRVSCDAAAFKSRLNGEGIFKSYSNFSNIICGANCDCNLKSMEEKTLFIVLSSEEIKFNKLSERSCYDYYQKNMFRLETDNVNFDFFFNDWLLYQVYSSRLKGRCGYYQAGGAFGFRDQLQDSLAFLANDPALTKNQIILSAARQFTQGDVMHWWHMPYFGVRTKMSDDRLFLPYVTAEYVLATGDDDVLSTEIPYLDSPPLSDLEESRLESPKITHTKESLLLHIKKAIDYSLSLKGEHGLLLIGTGDWNDALDKVGHHGKGESIWLSMFAYMTIKKCLPFFKMEERVKYIEEMENLKTAVDSCFEQDRFLRAISDDGIVLGSKNSEVCKIDLLPQAFSVLSEITTPEKQIAAMESAKELVDKENAVIALLKPPYDSLHNFGYISDYPAGIRENGGQYTHASIWYIIALCRLGKKDEAYDLLLRLIPSTKCENEIWASRYKGEPYVVSADVYTNADYFGKMGWSWYTGSASWLYKCILEEIVGVKIINRKLVVSFNLPDNLNIKKLTYQYHKHKYVIRYHKCGKKSLKENGINIYDDKIFLSKEEGETILDLSY